MTDKEFVAGHTSAELTELLALDRIDPPPDFYLLFGRLIATVRNACGDTRCTAADVFPHLKDGSKRREQRPEEQLAILSAITASRTPK